MWATSSRRWVWPLAALLMCAAVAVGMVAVVPSSRAVEWTAARHAARPRLLSLEYGRFRPQGAPRAYLALRLRVSERGGQVVETVFHELPSGFNADGLSRCGIGGRKSGRVETFFMPISPRLARGAHDFRVTAIGSSCKRGGATSSATRTFKLSVP